MKTKTKKAPTLKKSALKDSPSLRAGAGPAGRQAGPKDKDLETIHNEVVAKTEVEHIEDWVGVDCPFCGEGIDVHVTSEQDGQTMYEDCGVCCRPVQLHIHVEEGELQVEAHRS